MIVPSPWIQLFASTIRHITTFIALLLTVALASNGSAGDAPDTSRLKLNPERVVVFKDGYCLVVKQCTATTDAEGVVFTDNVPDAAVLGSFWAVPEEGTIRSFVAGWVDTEQTTHREITCTSIMEIVKSNLGKECSLDIREQRIEGTLLKILSNDSTDGDKTGNRSASGNTELGHRLSSYRDPTALPTSAATTTSLSSVNGEYFLVRTPSGDKMIQASMVSNLTIEEMNSVIEQTKVVKSRYKRLSMNFGTPNTAVRIRLMYFRPDVRWIPTYRVNLTGQVIAAKKAARDEQVAERKKAELIMQGEILNEAEDFINVPFHLVVGVPNFRFRSIPSPMTLEATIRNALGQGGLDSNGFDNFSMSNAIMTQRAGDFNSNRTTGDEPRTAVDLPDELIGKGGNDLFVYELPPMTLKRGERAMVPILRTNVDYRDIYTWDIELTHSESYTATSTSSPSPLKLSQAKVWRQVELLNNTNIPWTTGAAMLVDEMQPLAQELLTYTSPGGICRVPVTVSVDLRGRVEDTEVKREFKALSWRGHNYARIEGKIEPELANNKAEPVAVEVQLRFGGKATQASDDGKKTIEAFRAEDWHDRRGNPINNSSVIRWTQTILPGERFEPTVDYEFYLQH